MKKFKKVVTSLTIAGVILSTGGNTLAAENTIESTIPETEASINWDEAWEAVNHSNFIPSNVTLGSNLSNSNIKKNTSGITTLSISWGELATGNTSLASASGKITSTGTTKGKVFTTVTSATTSLRLNGMGYITGSKSTAIAKFTSTSEVSTSNPSGTQSFEGLTIHTATDSGVIYEARTYASGNY